MHRAATPGVARTPALRTRNIHIRQELHIQADLARSVADRTAQLARVVGKIPRLVTQLFRFLRPRIDLPQFIVHIGIGRHRGTDIDPDRRGVDQLDLTDARRIDRTDMFRQFLTRRHRFQRRDQTLQNQGRLPRTGNARHDRETPFRNIHFERFDRMDRSGRKMDPPKFENIRIFLYRQDVFLFLQERPDHGMRVPADFRNNAFRDHPAAVRSRFRPQLDQPVGGRQYFRVMVDQDHRIAVRDQIVHHPFQSDDVGRMQSDRGFVQHIQDPGRAVAHRPRQLHPLPFPGRQSRGRPVQRQIPQSEFFQPSRHLQERFADAPRHRPHFLRQRLRHALHPHRHFVKRHRADFRQRFPAQQRSPRRLGQPRTAAVRADLLFQELFHPFHPGFVLDFRQRVFNRIDRIVIGEIQFARGIGILRFVQNMFLDRRTVVDDLFFPLGQFGKRNIRADAHRPADIGHQRPHQRIPRGDRALVDGQRFIRHQSGKVDRPDRSRAVALAAGALAVERQFFRPRRIEFDAAFRTGQFLFRRDRQRGSVIMSVGTAVAGQPGEHQPQTVEQFGAGPERAADPRHAGTLMQSQRSGHIKNFIHLRSRRLSHASAGISGQRFQIPPRTFRIEHAQCERGFPRTRHPGDPDDLMQRDIHVDIFQVMDPCSADQYFVNHLRFPFHSESTVTVAQKTAFSSRGRKENPRQCGRALQFYAIDGPYGRDGPDGRDA